MPALHSRRLALGALGATAAAAIAVMLFLPGSGRPAPEQSPTPSPPNATASPTAPKPIPPVWSGPAAADHGYTVMSYNITDASRTPEYAGMADHANDFAWSKRGPVIASWIAAAAPDLLGLQEVSPIRGGGEQIDLLRLTLPAYTWVNPLRSTALAFRTAAFTLVDSGVIRVSHKHRDGSDYNRYAPWVKLRTRDGRLLLYVNLHAETGQSTAKAKARSVGWKRLVHGLATLNPGRRLPVILTGDFNASDRETRPVFRDHLDALSGAGLVSARRTAKHRVVRVPGATSFNGFGADINGRWRYRAIRRDADGSNFDGIWLGGGAAALAWQTYLGPDLKWQVIEGQIVPFATVIPSDHWPVLAKVALSRRSRSAS